MVFADQSAGRTKPHLYEAWPRPRPVAKAEAKYSQPAPNLVVLDNLIHTIQEF